MRRKLLLGTATLMLVSWHGGGFARAKPKVAVLPLTFIHLARLNASEEGDRVRALFRKSGRFEVLTREQTVSGLKKAGVKDDRCHEVECAVEFGGALKVDKVLAAQVLQLGRRSLMRIRYVDVASAKAEVAESIDFVGKVTRVPEILRVVALRALRKSVPATTKNKPVMLSFDGPKPPFYTRPWFLVTIGTVVAAGTAAGLVLGLRSPGPTTGDAVIQW